MRLTDEQRDLVANNLPLAKWYVLRHVRESRIVELGGLDDAIQVATIGLCRAARTWDASKGRFARHSIA